MSDEAATQPAAVQTIDGNHNGFTISYEIPTLTKGKGKGRVVLIPASKYASSVDELITLIRAYPESVGHIYKTTYRAAALVASAENVKSPTDINEHDYNADLINEWNVSRSADPVKLAEEAITKFMEENETLANMLTERFSEIPAIIHAAEAGDPTAKEQYAQLSTYSAELTALKARHSRLLREKRDKKAKKSKKV